MIVLRSLLLLELQQPRTQQQAASGATSLRVLNSFAASFDSTIQRSVLSLASFPHSVQCHCA